MPDRPAEQATLPLSRTAVRVNEVKALLYTTRQTANWWTLYRSRGPEERFRTVVVGFPGDVVDVVCDSQEHAHDLMKLLIDRGIPPRALKIVQIVEP